VTARLVHRPPRSHPPLAPAEPETLAPPPALDSGDAHSARLYGMLPVAGGLVAVLSITLFRIGNRVFLVIGAALLVAVAIAVVVVLLTRTGRDARRRRAERERYLDYLEEVRVRMRGVREHQRAAALLRNPAPVALADVVRDPARLWERRRRDADFLDVRLGQGDVRVAMLQVPPASDPLRPYDPILLAEATAVTRECPRAGGMPLTVSLDGAEQVAVVGDRREVLDTARTVLHRRLVRRRPTAPSRRPAYLRRAVAGATAGGEPRRPDGGPAG